MRAAFKHLSCIHYQDHVGCAYCGQTVRDYDRSAIDHQGVERSADLFFADRIEVRVRLVENQDRRVFQECPRDRDTLTLTAGKLNAAFANARL